MRVYRAVTEGMFEGGVVGVKSYVILWICGGGRG